MDYLTPQSMAEMESERQRLAQRQQLMQAMMGGNYIPDSGRAGVATSILGSIIGAIGGKRNNEDIRAFMERSFEADNQKAQAEFERKQREEQKKFEREIEAASRKAQAEAKAKRDFATKEFTGGGVFDPSTGQFTGSPEWMQQQLGLKSAEARIAAANRAPASDPFAKIKAAVQAGVITPEEAQQAMKQDLIGGSRQSAPSGYKFTADGGLEPIPGGPADKPAEQDPKQAAAAQARQLLEALRKQIPESGPIEGRIPTPATQQFDRTVAQLVNPFQTLTRIPGQGAQSDKELATLMASFPSATNFENVNESSIANLESYLDKLQGQGAPASAGAAEVGKIITAPNGKRYRIVGGDPNDPDVEPVE
jgi:hypothetical protein